MVAAKESAQTSAASNIDEDDVPLWDVHSGKNDKEIPPQVERVLSMIPGTIVE
jgi:hypothetical protein